MSRGFSLIDNDVLRIVEVLTDADIKSDWTMKVAYLHFSVRRLLTNAETALGYVVQIQDTDNIGALNTVVNPFSANALDIGSSDVMAWGLLPIPANVQDGAAGGYVISREAATLSVVVKAKRRIRREKEAITLTIATKDVDNLVGIQVLGRALLLG